MLDKAANVETSNGIAVSDLTVTYRNGHTALYDASFEIPTGTITGLVGVNGSGKSYCRFLRAGVAGVDEAGRGPLAGPVVAAAVVLDSASCTKQTVTPFDSRKQRYSRQSALPFTG